MIFYFLAIKKRKLFFIAYIRNRALENLCEILSTKQFTSQRRKIGTYSHHFIEIFQISTP